jgi:MFS family permease
MIFSSIVLSMFLAAMDETIVATALPATTGALGDVQRVSWILVTRLVGNAIAAPVFEQLGGAIRRKKKTAPALGFFADGSLLRAVNIDSDADRIASAARRCPSSSPSVAFGRRS